MGSFNQDVPRTAIHRLRQYLTLDVWIILAYSAGTALGMVLECLLANRFVNVQIWLYWAISITRFLLIPFAVIYSFVRILQKKPWRFALIGPALAVVVVFYLPTQPPVGMVARYTLADGRLASLPKSAVRIRAYHWSSLFSGESYVKFEADPADIEKFVKDSPVLENAKVEFFDAGASKPENDANPLPRQWRNSEDPPWWDPQIKGRGRRFEIPPDDLLRGHNCGELIIWDDLNTVFVRVVWS